MSPQALKTYMHKLDDITTADNKTLEKQVRLKNSLIRHRTEMEIAEENDDTLLTEDEMRNLNPS